jgi:hypothetical protein
MKVEHFVPFQRRAKHNYGIAFLGSTLSNCDGLAVEYVDTNGFVLSANITATVGVYTIECAWETSAAGATGSGKLKDKLSDKIKAAIEAQAPAKGSDMKGEV